ncbi:MAG TPA: hypothetical protein VK943_01150, partial [Arenibaculum sp.]|nr:hypothetical protein [Arenibaculum sp.]
QECVKWLVIGGIAVTGMFFLYNILLARSSGVDIVAEAGGQKFEVHFGEDEITLVNALDRILEPVRNPGDDNEWERRLLLNILSTYDLYQLRSEQMIAAIERSSEGELRKKLLNMLYSLRGPFMRPETFYGVTDDRIADALEDLYQSNPDSPLIQRLWEASVELTGIFKLRRIPGIARRGATIASGEASACPGSVLEGKNVLLQPMQSSNGFTPAVRLSVNAAAPLVVDCGTRRGEHERIWLSPETFNDLFAHAEADPEQGGFSVGVWILPRQLALPAPVPPSAMTQADH